MPCTARARGTKAGSNPPFNDITDNDPCGRKIVLTANGGQDFSAHTLCPLHLQMKLGLEAVKPPFTIEA